MGKRRRFRSCGFGQPPTTAPSSSAPNFLDNVDPTFLRGKYAPGTGDMACVPTGLGGKLMQAAALVDGAAEIDTKARKDRLYNRSYFQKLSLAQGLLNRLDLESSDCVKWDHPPSPEIVAARQQFQQRIEGLRREMRAMAGLRKGRRR